MKTFALALFFASLLSFSVAEETTTELSALMKELKGSLVKVEGKSLKKFDDTSLSESKYIVLYFSAHWCPPCRTFTPKLVEFYNQYKPNNPEMEFIFVSRDRSDDAMKDYMIEASMPWPAIKLSQVERKKTVNSYAGNGIPCLVVLDPNGKVLFDTNKNGHYRGPQAPLLELENLLKK